MLLLIVVILLIGFGGLSRQMAEANRKAALRHRALVAALKKQYDITKSATKLDAGTLDHSEEDAIIEEGNV